MSKLIKRKDGSYSKRGLWDNIRANKGSGKKPTKEMLKQESKIKKEENMKSMYKAGGKTSKPKMKKGMPSFMEESNEVEFGAPGVRPPMKKMMGGETGMEANGRQNRFEGKANMAGKKKYEAGGRKTGDPLKQANITAASDNTSVSTAPKPTGPSRPSGPLAAAQNLEKISRQVDKASAEYTKKENAKKEKEAANQKYWSDKIKAAPERRKLEQRNLQKKGGFPDLNGDKEITFGDILKGRLKGGEGKEKMMGGKMYKKGGKKTMEPGGGGRFAKMVSGLKKEGKSEDSAKAIAASVGRKKYGKSRFQAMAAAGKKKMMGGKKC